ncbi:Aromatic-L-amino-acid decarboxylase, protein [Aphelenchoides fujianensis]|nr:Aromatic-L-amino-acid decarboxylase, protein [Aphelenchoides fujianensis]
MSWARWRRKYGCWFHLDAAYGGGALLCPEYRHLAKGIEMVDSTNVNMHKASGSLLSTMLLCSVPMSFLWSRRKVDMENAFAVLSLRIQLSRRSLALKGWFVMRMFGLKGMQEHVRRMVRMADRFRELIAKDERFEMVGKPILTLAAFRLRGEHTKENGQHTMELCDFLNRSHRIFVTHARPMGIDVIRVNISFNLTSEADIDESYAIISQLTDEFLAERPQFSSLRFVAREATPIAGSPATPRTDPTNSPHIKRAVSPPSSSVKAVSPKSLRAARSKVDRNNN